MRLNERDIEPIGCCVECDYSDPASSWHAFWRYKGFILAVYKTQWFVLKNNVVEHLESESQREHLTIDRHFIDPIIHLEGKRGYFIVFSLRFLFAFLSKRKR